MKKILTSFFLLLLIGISSLSQERTVTEAGRQKEYSATGENTEKIYIAFPANNSGCLQGKFVGAYLSITKAQGVAQEKYSIINYEILDFRAVNGLYLEHCNLSTYNNEKYNVSIITLKI